MEQRSMRKRLTALLLTAGLAVSATACGQSTSDETEVEDSVQAMEPEISEAEPSESENSSIVTIRDIDEDEEDTETDEPEVSEPAEEIQPSEEPVQASTEPEVSEEPVPSVDDYTYTDVSKTVYAAIALNVRSGPSTDFSVIGAYPNGGEIQVTGQCNETGWYRVNYNSGTTGYCDSGYTADAVTQAQPKTETAADNSSNESNSNESNSNDNNGSNAGSTADNSNADSGSSGTSAQYGVVSAGDSGVSSYYVSQVQSAFNSVPAWVQQSFADNGWQIKVRSGSWWTEFGYGVQLKGLTSFDNKTVYISGRDDSANYHTVCHEIGHYVDFIYGWPSCTSEFNGIYNSEYAYFCSYYSYSNGYPGVEELFAEALYHYWSDSTLASVAPKTYAYLQRTFS